jgi:hypothetical protein
MTPEEKQMALTKIEELEQGGGAWQRRQARRLRKILEQNAGEFWPEYFDIINQPSVEAAVLIRSGAVTEATTLAELWSGKFDAKGGDEK